MDNRLRTQQEGHDHAVCPYCKAELCAGLIRETIKGGPYSEAEIRDMYGLGLCYSQVIGQEIPEKYDGVFYWFYPCCGRRQNRWTGEEVT